MIRITETLRDWATSAGRAATEAEAGRPSIRSLEDQTKDAHP